MINLKNILEGVVETPESNPDLELNTSPTSETTGMMGQSPTTWDTPKAYAPAGAPVRTNEVDLKKKLTPEEKRNLLNMVSQFNEYRRAMKLADELQKVAENIVYIAEMTEKYGLNETSEWFEGVTLDKDMKEIKKHAGQLHKIANKVHPLVKEAEDCYESIGLKLERYFNL